MLDPCPKPETRNWDTWFAYTREYPIPPQSQQPAGLTSRLMSKKPRFYIIANNYVWIGMAAVLGVIYVVVLGRGITLHR